MSSSDSGESTKSVVFNSSAATLNATLETTQDKEEQRDAVKDQQLHGLDQAVFNVLVHFYFPFLLLIPLLQPQ